MTAGHLVPVQSVELVKNSEVPGLLQQVRPNWQAKNLISRVRRLLEVDPSSACQRLFNASVHDLREKVAIAGIDLAKQAASQHGLPTVNKSEDLEQYPTAKLIDLSYRIGLLSRPEWRRVSRCYEIRRDLEHEDDEYEAGVEDCVYIFKTCIEVILARDPIHLLRVTDVKEVVEEAKPATPADSLLEDYGSAPPPRQEEIMKFLMSYALNKDQSDIVQQNAFTFLQRLEPLTQNSVKLNLATYFQGRVGRRQLDRRHTMVAHATGVLPYLKKTQRADYFESVLTEMEQVGGHWRAYPQHGELLRSFNEVGGLKYCPEEQRRKILKWLVLTYLGEPLGRTSYGNIRHVFYSNTAAPLVREIIAESKDIVKEDLRALAKDRKIKSACDYRHIAQRFEKLLDIVDDG